MKKVILFPGTDAIETLKYRKLAWQNESVQFRIRLTETILEEKLQIKLDLSGYMDSEDDRSLAGFQKLVLCSLATQVALFDQYASEFDDIDAVLGLSLGDIARSVVTKMVRYEDAVVMLLKFTCLSQDAKEGASMHVKLPTTYFEMADQLKFESYGIEISVMQNDSFFMVAGSTPSLEKWITEIAKPLQLQYRLLYPFPLHSTLMDPVKESLKKEIRLLCKADQKKYEIFSTVFAKEIHEKEEIIADSILNINSSLWFTDTIRHIIYKYQKVKFVSIGPAPTLIQFIHKMKLSNPYVRLEDWFGGLQLNRMKLL